jgi:hypothetical protein
VDEEAEIARAWGTLDDGLRRDLWSTVHLADRIALNPETADRLPAEWARTQVWALEDGTETTVTTLRPAVLVFIRDVAAPPEQATR